MNAASLSTPRSPLVRYSSATAITLLAVTLRILLVPVMGRAAPYATLFAAVAFSVWFGGRRTAAWSAVLGFLLVDYFVNEPSDAFTSFENQPFVVGGLLYALSCTIIIALGRGMQTAIRRYELGEQELAAANRVATRRADELQALLDAAPVAIWVAHDPSAERITGNRLANDLTGGTRAWRAIIDADTPSRVKDPESDAPLFRMRRGGVELDTAAQPLQRAARGEPVLAEEVELLVDGRAPVLLTCNAAPLLDEHGDPRGAILLAADITARRQSEAEAARAQELLRLITDNLPALISYIDRDLRYQLNNRAYATWFGAEMADLRGKSPRDLGDAAWSRLRPHMERALAGETVTFEDEVNYAAAGWKYIRATYVPDRDERGDVAGFAVLVNDLSEHHLIERRVRRSEEAHRLLVEIHDATRGLHEPSSVLWEIVSRVRAHFGVTRCTYAEIDDSETFVTVARDNVDGVASITGRHRLDDFGPEITRQFKAGETVRVADVATDPRTRDGIASFNRIETRAVLSVPLVKSGRFVAVLALHDRAPHDWSADEVWLLEQIAERSWYLVEGARAEAAVRESRDVLALAMRGGAMGAWSRDTVTNELWWSRELEELFGLPPRGFEGTEEGFFQFVHPEDRALVANAVADAIAREQEYSVEFRIRHASGEWRWMEGRGRAVRAPGDGRLMLYGLGIDITERRRAQEALEEADRRKDEFLATLAHELRNPLAPIRNAAQFLRLKDRLDPELQSAREIIDRQVQHLVRLVDDLLDVSRISRGKVNLQRERVSLAVIVGNAVEASRPLIESLGHQLTVSLPPTPVMLDADLTRLAQVLTNLLNNSSKYTPNGGHIRLSAMVDGSQVTIRVADNGIGIAAEMLPRVFQLFTQAEHALERAAGGLGIGLTLVERLVALHGGTVEAQSEGPGLGSEFIVRLPLAQPSAVASPSPAEAELPSHPRAARVLVVDDNLDSADSLAMMLRFIGYEVETAYDGRAAIDAADRFRPEILLLDIGLPILSGYDVARAVRVQEWGRELLIVAISGWGQEEDRRQSQQAGFDHHLVKPVEHATLLALLSEHLQRRGAPPESREGAGSR